jgi:hypothetical protein
MRRTNQNTWFFLRSMMSCRWWGPGSSDSLPLIYLKVEVQKEYDFKRCFPNGEVLPAG